MSQNKPKKNPITYKNSGVDIEAGNNLIDKIKPYAKSTFRKEVLGSLGGFGSMFEMPEHINNPVLVSGTDGVGTKLKLAFELNKHDTIGQDLVAMCVNDIIVQGAEPLFFLDYYACGKLNTKIAEKVIKGISDGCKLAKCSLVGGETAEMPGMYLDDEYDLAGFCVGAVDKKKIIDGSDVDEGDVLLGISSSGAHSNGYSLIRKIISEKKINLNLNFGNESLGEVLMKPTKIYTQSILEVLKTENISAMAHITGGGLTENIPRVIPEGLKAIISKDSWGMPKLFKWIKSEA
ncbi:MAG: phosphoribosylformylglycinamidine cyclo-ligase, partial [Nitrosomonadales bacterium]|nr:phosphoribosylformylglycinamidine cyclo-ligase [Nitrosomonadales bacterium]